MCPAKTRSRCLSARCRRFAPLAARGRKRRCRLHPWSQPRSQWLLPRPLSRLLPTPVVARSRARWARRWPSRGPASTTAQPTRMMRPPRKRPAPPHQRQSPRWPPARHRHRRQSRHPLEARKEAPGRTLRMQRAESGPWMRCLALTRVMATVPLALAWSAQVVAAEAQAKAPSALATWAPSVTASRARCGPARWSRRSASSKRIVAEGAMRKRS